LVATTLAKRLFDQAEEGVELALALYPDYADLHLFLGIAFYKQHNYDDAANRYTQRCNSNPKYAKAMIYLGLTLLRKGSESGLADIASAVAVEPAYDDDRYEKRSHSIAMDTSIARSRYSRKWPKTTSIKRPTSWTKD